MYDGQTKLEKFMQIQVINHIVYNNLLLHFHKSYKKKEGPSLKEFRIYQTSAQRLRNIRVFI